MKPIMMAAMLSLASFGLVQAQPAPQVQLAELAWQQQPAQEPAPTPQWQTSEASEAAPTPQAAPARQDPLAAQADRADTGVVPSSEGSFARQQAAQYNQDPGE
ncbi:hypothetical protein GXW71_33560, partial [Roseomonas hellenica]